jgi:hypothetical protein
LAPTQDRLIRGHRDKTDIKLAADLHPVSRPGDTAANTGEFQTEAQ